MSKLSIVERAFALSEILKNEEFIQENGRIGYEALYVKLKKEHPELVPDATHKGIYRLVKTLGMEKTYAKIAPNIKQLDLFDDSEIGKLKKELQELKIAFSGLRTEFYGYTERHNRILHNGKEEELPHG